MTAIRTYELEMDPSDLRWFASHLGTDRCFPAELRIGGDRWPVWMGYRGRFSRWCDKPSYDLWFSDEDQFHGRTRLHLNAAYYDPSLLRGRFSLDLFRSLGVPTPEAWHVWLVLGGRPQGVYTAIEGVNATWLARRGITGSPIYYGVGRHGNFGLMDMRTGKPKRDLARGYEKCYPFDDDFSDLKALIQAISLPDDPEFEAGIDTVVDVENFLCWLAGIVFTSHTDGLVQNYALFKAADGRWQISPWDCDGTLGRCPDGHRLPADHMDLGGGGGNYLAARLLATPRWRRSYVSLWESLLEKEFRREVLEARLHALFASIREAALQDQMKGYANSTFLREPVRIRTYFAERTAFLRQRLAAWRSDVEDRAG